MTRKMTVHAIKNNMLKARPRQPLVQILAYEDSDIQSITFHPDHAEAIAKAIRNAGKAAKDGRDSAQEIELKDAS